jgi:hypothetical protein
MKQIVIIVLFLSFVVLAFASTALWPLTRKPPISIVEAVNLATVVANKDGGDFYCLNAMVFQGRTGCDWSLQFHSTNGATRCLEVGADKTVVPSPYRHF